MIQNTVRTSERQKRHKRKPGTIYIDMNWVNKFEINRVKRKTILLLKEVYMFLPTQSPIQPVSMYITPQVISPFESRDDALDRLPRPFPQPNSH